MQQHSGFLFLAMSASIASWVIGFSQQIIDAGVVKARQADEDGGGNVVLARFVFGIARLRHAQHVGYLGLIEVFIFAQIADALVFHVSLQNRDGVARPLYFNLFQGIDI